MSTSFIRLYRALVLLTGISMLFAKAAAQTGSDKFSKDTARISRLLDSAYRYIDTDFKKSAWSAEKAVGIARQSGYPEGLIRAWHVGVNVFLTQGKYRKALENATSAVALSKKIRNEQLLARSYSFKGMTGIFLGHFQMAADNLLDAAEIIDRTGSSLQIQHSLNRLSIAFTELRDKQRSLDYALKAEKLSEVNGNTAANILTVMQLARARALNGQMQLSEQLFERLLKMTRAARDSINTTYAHIYYAEQAGMVRKYNKALGFYRKALQHANRTRFPDFLIYSNGGLARTYYELQDYTNASAYLEKALYYARTAGSENMLRELLLLGSEIREQQQDLAASLHFRKEYEVLNARLLNLGLQQNVHRLEAEYQSSVKAREIARQKFYIVLSLFISSLLLAATLLIYFLYRNKQKIADKNLMLLQKEKEMQVLKAMIEGEETERSRLAKDLHDGVGGLLSATKMHLSILQNDSGTPDLLNRFNHTVSMLDSASQEIRMIAHNLAPELLVKFGLNKALSTYFSRLQSPGFKINYLKVGDVPRLSDNFELLVYRIIQELIHNVIKHAHCSDVLVQMSYHEQTLSVTVEDNGIGMKQQESEGLGLSSLRSRLAAVNGYMEIETSPGNGTTIFIEFDVQEYVIYDTNQHWNSR